METQWVRVAGISYVYMTDSISFPAMSCKAKIFRVRPRAVTVSQRAWSWPWAGISPPAGAQELGGWASHLRVGPSQHLWTKPGGTQGLESMPVLPKAHAGVSRPDIP